MNHPQVHGQVLPFHLIPQGACITARVTGGVAGLLKVGMNKELRLFPFKNRPKSFQSGIDGTSKG